MEVTKLKAKQAAKEVKDSKKDPDNLLKQVIAGSADKNWDFDERRVLILKA